MPPRSTSLTACATSDDAEKEHMAIPLSYNVRNLRLRKGLTVMTALGIALTVATAIFIMALLAGLDRAFGTTGDPLNVLVLRKGSTSELSAGGVARDDMQTMKDLPGVARNSQGEPLVPSRPARSGCQQVDQRPLLEDQPRRQHADWNRPMDRGRHLRRFRHGS